MLFNKDVIIIIIIIIIINPVPRALFPGFEGGAGKGPGIGRSHDHQTTRICRGTKLAYDRIR